MRLVERVEIHTDGVCQTYDVGHIDMTRELASGLAARCKVVCRDYGRPYSFLFGWSVILLEAMRRGDQEAITRLCAALAAGEGGNSVWIEEWSPDETNVRVDRVMGRSSDLTIRREPLPLPVRPKPPEAPAAPGPAAVPDAAAVPEPPPQKPARRGRTPKAAVAAPPPPPPPPPLPAGGAERKKVDRSVNATVEVDRQGFVKWWKK